MGVKKTWSGLSVADREALRAYHEIRGDHDDDNLVGRMKVAAIDAYMETHQGGMWASYQRINANAISAVMSSEYWSLFPGGVYLRDHALGDDFIYERPCLTRRYQCGGEGGFAYHAVLLPGSHILPTVDRLNRRSDKDLNFLAIFRRVDAALDYWWDLPETGAGTRGDFGPATEIADDIADVAGELGLNENFIGGSGRMDVLIGDSEGSHSSPSSLWTYTNNTSDGKDDGFKSAAFWRWRSGFVTKMPQVVNACAHIAMWLASTVAAQARAWHIAKADVFHAVENARHNFQAVASSSGKLSPSEARFYKAAVHIAENYLPKPAETIYDAFGISSYLDKHIDGMTAAPGSNYESAMGKFKESLTKIDQHIEDSERAIAVSAVSLLEEIRNKRTLFELSHDGAGGDISIDITGEIKLRYDPVKVVTDILTEVAEILSSCASTVEGHKDAVMTVFHRRSDIGLGTYGPGWAVQEVAEMLAEMLRNLAYWCNQSIQAIWAVYYFLVRTNEDLADELRRRNPNLYYNDLPLHPDPWSEFLVHNANLVGAPPEEPFDYVIKDLEKRMNGEP
ncbi:MAG: hypothetical protein FWH11_11505 [Micrococcales bacterium]|nr:hypothetical protein [Micrococcales bacterium]